MEPFRRKKLFKLARELNTRTAQLEDFLQANGQSGALQGHGVNAAVTTEEAYHALVAHFQGNAVPGVLRRGFDEGVPPRHNDAAPAREHQRSHPEANRQEEAGSQRHFFGFRGGNDSPRNAAPDPPSYGRERTQDAIDRAALETLIFNPGSFDSAAQDGWDEDLNEASELRGIVSGHIVGIGDREVTIDFGYMRDGVADRSEFSSAIAIGDRVDVLLERTENRFGQPILSKEKVDRHRRWQTVALAYEQGTALEGTIIRLTKGGFVVDLMDGLEAFLPGSHVDIRAVNDFEAYLDRRMEFKILKINESIQNVVVSHRALREKEVAQRRQEIMDRLAPGQILTGVVKNITDWGAFLDLGGVDGLLHITELSWGRVAHPSEVVEIGQELRAVVLDFDKEKERITLGRRQLTPDPWEEAFERIKVGDAVHGKVISIKDYGAFVEVEPGIEGLVHVSEMSWYEQDMHPSEKVTMGEELKVMILGVEHESKKLSLGIKQFDPSPWDGVTERYSAGMMLPGTVQNIWDYGFFVELEPGIHGLVHMSKVFTVHKIEHPSELVQQGDVLTVEILEVDEARTRISLCFVQEGAVKVLNPPEEEAEAGPSSEEEITVPAEE